jgi:protein-S-isoprenylcysteine O-methyltransferase Ste14
MYLWCSTLAEIAVIIAKTFPSLPTSKIILENVLFGGNGGQIQFTTAAAIGMALGITGAALRAWCYRELGRFFTFEMTIMKDHNLVKTGPYDVVRHPSYTATFMTNIAIFLLYATRGSWVRESGLLENLPGKIVTGIFAAMVALGPLGVMRRMQDEDEALRKRFGEEWEAWAAKVRYMLIPGLW